MTSLFFVFKVRFKHFLLCNYSYLIGVWGLCYTFYASGCIFAIAHTVLPKLWFSIYIYLECRIYVLWTRAAWFLNFVPMSFTLPPAAVQVTPDQTQASSKILYPANYDEIKNTYNGTVINFEVSCAWAPSTSIFGKHNELLPWFHTLL